MSADNLHQDMFIQSAIEEQTFVSIYLSNGIRLQGHIAHQDPHCLLLKGMSDQVIYKHAIATIVPGTR